MSRVRAANPATLFRGGGRSLGDLAIVKPVPHWVPAHLRAEYRLTSLLEGEHAAASSARSKVWADDLRRARKA